MRSITIESIHIYPIAIPFVRPFRTSFGIEPFKACVLVEVVTSDGITGWGEASCEVKPGYGAETMATAEHILKNFLAPRIIGQEITNPMDVPNIIHKVRGNLHTKHGIEAAIWDAFARSNDMRLVDLFQQYVPDGHTSREHANVGVSIGIQPSIEETLDVIQMRLDAGYRRIKLKIQPGWDVNLAQAVRERFPDISLMLDANSAYTLADAEHLKQLDQYNLLMIEQPLAHHDIYEHSKLQAQLQTSVCLDESVKSVNDFLLALEVGACRILNLKPARVGGYVESLKIYQAAVEQNIPLWIGGMLETGVGRAANVAFASLPGVTLPCDISATERYFAQDVADPPFVLSEDSTLQVPTGVGTGVDIRRDVLDEATRRWQDEYPYVD